MTDVQTFFKEARQKRSKRAKAVKYAQARAEVIERSQGRCEVVLGPITCTSQGTQAHHIRRRSQGGQDTAENLIWICAAHHSWVHANPATAEHYGLLRRSSFDPAPGLVRVEKVKRT